MSHALTELIKKTTDSLYVDSISKESFTTESEGADHE